MSDLFNEEDLKASKAFKEWIVQPNIVLIHNIYWDAKQPYTAYIVVTMNKENLFTVTRFFKMGGNIEVSVDHANIPMKKFFKVLLSDYSRGLA